MNNNIINTNNFIGITHIDNIKLTSNILEQHILAGDIRSSNYTSNASNILNNSIVNLNFNCSNYTSNASNILNTNSSNYTDILRYDVNKWINEQIEHVSLPQPIDLIHTYIYSSNLLGEIRFVTKGTPDYVFNSHNNYIIKIKENGRLAIYYEYDLLFPTVLRGWYDIMDGIRDGYAYQATANGLIGGLQGEINNIYNTLEPLIITVEKHNTDIITLQSQVSLLNSINYIQQAQTSTYAELLETIEVARQEGYFNVYNNPVLAGLGPATIIGVAGSAIGSLLYTGYISEQAQYIFNSSNSNITNSQRNSLKTSMDEIAVSSIYNFSSNNSNLNIVQGFINSNITDQQYIANLKCDNLNLNTGNIANINGITTNELIANGKIKQNGILLDNTYLTSNHLYNLAYNYTSERQYPPKAYTATTEQSTITLLNKLVYLQTLYLDNSAISFGSGFYNVYSSSSYDTPTTKDKLFNYNTSETTTAPRWAINLYNSGTGNYQGDNSIDGTYFGDWVILKMPKEILLSRYRIYQRPDNLTKAPAEWKCYGSNDGINFIEIIEASQLTRLSSYTGGYFEKTLNPTFNILYQYIGFTFKSLLSTSGQTDLSFSELQLFGKEIINNSITSSIYATSNAVKNIIIYDTPVVCKHFAFYITITTPIVINGKNYYKYDIDLRQYTKLGYIDIGSQSGDSYRIFKLRACYGSMYFSTLVNGLPNVVYSDIFMSMKANPTANLGAAGLNICSIGSINNPRLDIVPSNNLFFMRNGANSIDYITVVSTNVADVRCFIEDMIS